MLRSIALAVIVALPIDQRTLRLSHGRVISGREQLQYLLFLLNELEGVSSCSTGEVVFRSMLCCLHQMSLTRTIAMSMRILRAPLPYSYTRSNHTTAVT